MKKILILSVLMIAFLCIDSCSKLEIQKNSSDVISLDQNVLKTINLKFDPSSVFIVGSYKGNNDLLKQLFNSETWASIPKSIKSEIEIEPGVNLSDYKNSRAQTITFKLKNNQIYRDLVIYSFGEEYIPVIASAQKFGDQTYLSVSDLSKEVYYDFYVKNNKMGQFKVHKDMPRFKESSYSVQSKTEDPTCMEETDAFGECMLCAIDECSHDWVCAVVCAIMAGECLAGFGISCLID